MTDALEIANLKARYCAAVDMAPADQAQARAALASVFTDDFIGDYGFGTMDGPKAIIDFMCSAVAANSEWMIHMLHSPSINVTGDTATGDWTVMAHMKRREGGAVDLVLGRYTDEFRRTVDGWRIAKITFGRIA